MTTIAHSSRDMGKKIFILFLAAVLAVLIPLVTGLKVRRELERRLDLSISGRVVPHVLRPSFDLREAKFEWRGRVRLESGDLRVDYDLPAFWLKNSLRLRLSGKNLHVRLLDAWAQSQGVGAVELKRFRAGLEFDRQGLKDIDYVDAESPALQFHVKKTENRTSTKPHPENTP